MAQLQSFRKQAKDGLTSLKLPKEEKVSILKARRNPKIFGAIWKNLVFPEWHENFEAFGTSRYRSYTAISPQPPHPSIFSHLNSEDVETETDISEGPPTLRKNLSVIPGKMLGRMNTRERFPRSFGVNSSEKKRIFRF